MQNIKYKSLMLDAETKQKIQYMARAQNKSMSALLREIIEELFVQSSEFKKCIMCVAGHSGSVTFAFSGKSTLIFGTAQTDEEMKRQVEDQLNERDNHE